MEKETAVKEQDIDNKKVLFYGFSHDEILEQTSNEYSISYRFIKDKRDLFRERMREYINIDTNKDKVYVRLLFAIMQTLMSLNYSDDMTVEFMGRQVGSFEVAENMQRLAEFDYEEMNMAILDYRLERSRLFFGVGLLIYDSWDSIQLNPNYRVVNPMCRVPDMNPDPITGARYHQFEVELHHTEITTENGYVNFGELLGVMGRNKEDIEGFVDEELEKNKDSQRERRVLNKQRIAQGYIPVRYCYTIIKGEKYFVASAMGKWIIKMKKLVAVLAEEIKDPRKIQFPVFEFHMSPLEGDPFGVNICDILADKQRAQQLLLNLELIKAKHQAFGDIWLYDPTKINARQLLKDRKGPVFIKAKKAQDLSNVMVEVPKGRISSDINYVKEELKRQATLDIGLDERSLGVMGEKNITATENQRIQQNANIRQMLNINIKMRGRKKFRKDRQKRYYENFKFTSEKNIIINSRFGSRAYTIKRKDIFTANDIQIKIVSKSEQKVLKDQKKLAYEIIAADVLNNPGSPEISKTLVRRERAVLNGMTSEEASMYYPPTVEEEQAMLDVELINNDEVPKIYNVDEDHRTFEIVYQRAYNTPAKFRAIQMRKMLFIQTGQAKKQVSMVDAQQVQQGGTSNQSVANQLVNGEIQNQSQQKAASFSDISE